MRHCKEQYFNCFSGYIIYQPVVFIQFGRYTAPCYISINLLSCFVSVAKYDSAKLLDMTNDSWFSPILLKLPVLVARCTLIYIMCMCKLVVLWLFVRAHLIWWYLFVPYDTNLLAFICYLAQNICNAVTCVQYANMNISTTLIW